MKRVVWMGDTLERVRAESVEIRSDVGYQLKLVQQGHAPPGFRPMPDVGPGVTEIRVHGNREYRVFYVARFEEAIYVLHAFIKKSRTTAKQDIDLGRRRYAAVIQAREKRQ